MAEYLPLFRKKAVVSLGEMQQDAKENGGRYQDGQRVRVLGVVQAVRQKATRKGESMAFITLEDPYGSMELLVFPNVYTRYHSLFREGAVVLAEGRVSLTEDK